MSTSPLFLCYINIRNPSCYRSYTAPYYASESSVGSKRSPQSKRQVCPFAYVRLRGRMRGLPNQPGFVGRLFQSICGSHLHEHLGFGHLAVRLRIERMTSAPSIRLPRHETTPIHSPSAPSTTTAPTNTPQSIPFSSPTCASHVPRPSARPADAASHHRCWACRLLHRLSSTC